MVKKFVFIFKFHSISVSFLTYSSFSDSVHSAGTPQSPFAPSAFLFQTCRGDKNTSIDKYDKSIIIYSIS